MRDNDSATDGQGIALRPGPPSGPASGPPSGPASRDRTPDSGGSTGPPPRSRPVTSPAPGPADGPGRRDGSGVGAGAGHRAGRPSSAHAGTALAALGVAAFSFTFPATLWALEGMGPWTVTAARALLAALTAGGCLLALRVPVPERRHWPGLLTVAAGVVIGFPLLTTLALRTSTASHAAVVIGLLPLTTAVFAAVRTRTRHSPAFWGAALAGATAVTAFALTRGGGGPGSGDLLLGASLLVCAAGYTEGGRLARLMPGWQVIAWALVACLPLALPGLAAALAREPFAPAGPAIGGLLWLACSQFLGMVVWYRAMAAIGVARAGQLQLAQPLLTLLWAVLFLGEEPEPAAPLTATAVLACIAVTQRAGRRAGRRGSAGSLSVQGPSAPSGPRLEDDPRTPRRHRPREPGGPEMEAKVGDTLVMHGRSVGQHDRTAQIIEVLGTHGEPPYRVRFDDGHEALMSPGPDSVVQHERRGTEPA
ncbi:DUF1918 domain-containing protein [Streptomyces sp. F63]|uniref:DUF1918 domain-containing protein n=1 Tax=Streptomyces sp. F63 TaxID=2824887 RepID=UPI001B361638|nr:DUF1918 domain-containing protein [Streptomyces sp. F63]